MENTPPSELEGDLTSRWFIFFFFFPLSCLEMASDVSSLGAAVSSGNPGQGAQAGGAIVQRANKRRPG